MPNQARLSLKHRRPGDIPYIDPSGEEVVLHKPSASSVLTHSGADNGLAWTLKSGLLVAGDLPSHTHTAHDNRTRVWPVDLAAGFLAAGTGTLNVSAGLRITYVDAELGTWRWQIPIP